MGYDLLESLELGARHHLHLTELGGLLRCYTIQLLLWYLLLYELLVWLQGGILCTATANTHHPLKFLLLLLVLMLEKAVVGAKDWLRLRTWNQRWNTRCARDSALRSCRFHCICRVSADTLDVFFESVDDLARYFIFSAYRRRFYRIHTAFNTNLIKHLLLCLVKKA